MLEGIAPTRRKLHHHKWPDRPDGLDQDRGQVDEEEYVTPEATRRAVQWTVDTRDGYYRGNWYYSSCSSIGFRDNRLNSENSEDNRGNRHSSRHTGRSNNCRRRHKKRSRSPHITRKRDRQVATAIIDDKGKGRDADLNLPARVSQVHFIHIRG